MRTVQPTKANTGTATKVQGIATSVTASSPLPWSLGGGQAPRSIATSALAAPCKTAIRSPAPIAAAEPANADRAPRRSAAWLIGALAIAEPGCCSPYRPAARGGRSRPEAPLRQGRQEAHIRLSGLFRPLTRGRGRAGPQRASPLPAPGRPGSSVAWRLAVAGARKRACPSATVGRTIEGRVGSNIRKRLCN